MKVGKMTLKSGHTSLALLGLTAVAVLLFSRLNVEGQESTPGLRSSVVWYGILEDGLAEAKSTGKPILLLSAAPNCVGVSGIW